MTTGTIDVEVPGATDEELDRGIAAAMDVFTKAAVHPFVAAAAHFKREGWDIDGFPEGEGAPTDEEMEAADLWDQAEQAGVAACCANWPERTDNACLRVTFDKEPGAVD